MRRGAEAVVPTVPGLVSETVVPMKSSGRDRALARRGATSSSKAFRNGREVELPRVLDVGDEQRARAVLLLHVHRDAQADLVALDAVGLALQLRVGVVEAREGVERAQDGPGHEVGEADLARRRRRRGAC